MTSDDAKALFERELSNIEVIIRYVCFQRAVREHERADLYSWVMWKLVENDYRRIRGFRGQSKFGSYITTVVQRLYVDFRVHLWGKWHPSTTASSLGELCEELERLVYKERRGFDEAAKLLASRRADCPPRETLWEWHERLPRRDRRHFEELGDTQVQTHWTPEREAIAHEHREEQARLAFDLAAAMDGLAEEERVIVQTSFRNGSSAREIGDALKLPARQVYGKRARAMRKLHTRMATMGWTRADVMPLLGWGTLDLGWT